MCKQSAHCTALKSGTAFYYRISVYRLVLFENGKENIMQLSEKELSSINDLLSEEELLTKKFKMLAEQTTDTELKDKFTNISEKHQQHFNSLYKLLG